MPTASLGDSVDNWIDAEALEPFAVTVDDIDLATGDLVTYIPLSPTTDDTEGQVAFSARMMYRPSQAGWGVAHEYRLIWLGANAY